MTSFKTKTFSFKMYIWGMQVKKVSRRCFIWNN